MIQNLRFLPILTIRRTLTTIALIILLFYAVVYTLYAINLIQFPFDYDQGEGFELVDAIMFSEGEFPYADLETYPFYGSIYPPVYHIILVPFVWVFGPQYWYGRLVSFLGTLITAGAISYAVNREGKNRTVAILAGLAFLASNIVYHVGPLFRQHMLMVMFEVLAIVILANVNEIEITRKRRRQIALGLGLLILGGYTKQLAAFTAIAALAFLFIRNPRRGIVWGIGFGIIGAGIFTLLTIATDGHWWTQTVTANVKDFSPDQAIGLLKLWFKLHIWLLIPAGLYILYELYFSRISIYTIWFIVTTLLSAMSAGTWGAGDSYYATSIASLCVLSGIFLAKMVTGNWTFYESIYKRLIIDPLQKIPHQLASLTVIIVPMFYIAYGATVLHMPTEGTVFEEIADVLDIQPNALNAFYDSAGRTTNTYANIGHFTTQADIDAGHYIVSLIEESGEQALSEEAAFSLRSNQDVVTNPVVLMILSWVDAFDSTELVGMLNEQAFSLVILRAQFYPVEVNQAITANYEQTETVYMNGFDYIIKRPR